MERKPTYEELEQSVKELRLEVKQLKSILRDKASHNEIDGQKVENYLNEKSTDFSFPKKIPTFWFDRYFDNRIVKYEYPIHIYGEPGTCKESLALYIHSKSARRKFKFVTVHCSSTTDDILEQELFGHCEDHITGASHSNKGCFELADRGTIFLDDISELSSPMQYKLNRVLTDGMFKLIGKEKVIPVNVRIISSSKKGLKNKVQCNKFRPDLFYQLNVIPINLLPLRERKDDIYTLIDYFLIEYSSKFSHKPPVVSEKAMSLLLAYYWPGNVSELQSTIQFSIVKCSNRIILPEDLPLDLQQEIMPQPISGSQKKLDINMVKSTLKKTGGNKAKTARMLGVGRQKLQGCLVLEGQHYTGF